MNSAWLFLAASVALPPVPPEAPDKTEIVISGVGDNVAAQCAANEAHLRSRLKTTQLKVVITKSQKWGTIWRQDVAFPVERQNERPILWRSVCWKGGTLERPLDMFDSKASIGPLK